MEQLDLINALDEIDLILAITVSAFDAEINESHLGLLKDSIALSQQKLATVLQKLERKNLSLVYASKVVTDNSLSS